MAKERIRETRVIPERGITIECGALKEDWSGSVWKWDRWGSKSWHPEDWLLAIRRAFCWNYFTSSSQQSWTKCCLHFTNEAETLTFSKIMQEKVNCFVPRQICQNMDPWTASPQCFPSTVAQTKGGEGRCAMCYVRGWECKNADPASQEFRGQWRKETKKQSQSNVLRAIMEFPSRCCLSMKRP